MAEMTEFSIPSGIDWAGEWGGMVKYGPGDAGMVVMFYNRPVHNPAKSAQEGRPIFEDKVYVKIHPPGERLNIIDRPAEQSDRQRWPMQWQQFSQNKQQTPSGTPVDLLYPEQPSVAAMLRASHVHTIEQLANLSGNAIDNIGMGGQQYVNDARRFIEASSKGVGSVQFRQTIEKLESDKRVLQQQVDQLRVTVQAMQQQMGNQPSLSQLQGMLAGVMQVPTQMPQIDGQAHMIQNLDPRAELVRQKPIRKRARIGK